MLTLAEVAAATGGALGGGADPAAAVLSVTIDSRRAGAGALFAALPGEHVDGHGFAAAAAAAGAVAVLASRPVAGPHVLVADVTAALAGLAALVRDRLGQLRVVAVTGSSGKTTTKDLLVDVLAGLGPVVAPPGSYNNDLGVPLTVLASTAQTRTLVLEMGARGAGHIARLAAYSRPHVGVVLNVGSAHLGVFGSRAAIAAAKGELVAAASDYVVLNADDPAVAAMAPAARGGVLTVSPYGDPGADLRADRIELQPSGGARFDLVTRAGLRAPVELQLAGEHQVGNALAAAAVGQQERLAVGVPAGPALQAVAAALAAARPRSRWRMELLPRPGGGLLINDAYNANPESMRAALKTLVTLARSRSGRAVAVLGEMGELGPDGAAEHDAIGRLAVRLDVRQLVVVGEGARALHLAATQEGSWDSESVWVADVDAALQVLGERLQPTDVVLVKASRAAGLERLAAALVPQPNEDGRT